MLCQILLLVLALSLDTLAAAATLGGREIRLPLSATLILGGGSALALTLSAAVGQQLSDLLPAAAAARLSWLILTGLGLARLLDGLLRGWTGKTDTPAQLQFHLLRCSFLLQVWRDSAAADVDRSRSISPAEALPLSLALSLDSLAAGVGAAFPLRWLPLTAFLCLVAGCLSVWAGTALGRKAAALHRADPGLAAGLLLLALGAAKLRGI